MNATRETFSKWRDELLKSGSIAPLALGATQEEITATFGAPDRSSAEKKNGKPVTFKYADIEFHFDHQSGHRLFLIYGEREDGTSLVTIKAT
jgi:hypothetical protein